MPTDTSRILSCLACLWGDYHTSLDIAPPCTHAEEDIGTVTVSIRNQLGWRTPQQKIIRIRLETSVALWNLRPDLGIVLSRPSTLPHSVAPGIPGYICISSITFLHWWSFRIVILVKWRSYDKNVSSLGQVTGPPATSSAKHCTWI